ncbi:MAG: hypothetical protein ACXIUD_03075 [Mongoliitalea sp.]
MESKDIRWIHRLSNYKKALAKLDEAVSRIKEDYHTSDDGSIAKDSFLDHI